MNESLPRKLLANSVLKINQVTNVTKVLDETTASDRVSRSIKGGPEPLEKEIHEILGSKREDRFSNPFFELVQTTCQVNFSYLRLGNICKGPRTLQKFPQKCQKIAGC